MSTNLFKKAPIVGTFYKKFAKDKSHGGKVYENLPSPQFDFLKTKMQKLQNDIHTYNELMKKQKKIENLDSKYVPIFTKTQRILSEVLNPEQFSMNERTKLNYLDFKLNKGDNDSSQFSEWYISDLQNQFKQIRFTLMENYGLLKNLLNEELTLKSSVLDYQEQIIQNLTEWIEFIDDKVNESTITVKLLNSDVSKETRSASMEYESIVRKDRLKDFLFYSTISLFFITFVLSVIVYYKDIFTFFFGNSVKS